MATGYEDETVSEHGLLKEPVQSDLVQRYCGGIEDRIRTARSLHDARSIAETACTAFDGACESALVKSSLTRYIEGLLTRHWNVSMSSDLR